MSNKKNLSKSVSIIIFFSLISKALGFIREALMASKFGIGYEADTYIVAIAATTFLASMISNSLSSTVIPVGMGIDKDYGKRKKDQYFSNIINLAFIVGFLLIFFSYIFSPYIIKIFAHGFEGEQLNLAVEVNRIALPAILFIILTAVFIGYLQSENRFTSTSLIGVSLNIVLIIYLLLVGNKFGIKGLAIAAAIAYLSQVIILIPETIMSNCRYVLSFNLKDKDLIHTLKLALPVMIGLSAQQINIIVDKTMASSLVEGSIASLNYAAITSLIFVEVFIVSITTVVFPVISDAVSDKNLNKLRKVVISGFRFILFIAIPASVSMIVLATPIIRVLFERGVFDNNATIMTVQAFVLYSFATVFIALKRLAQKVYYSFGNTKKPMINSVIEVVLNIGLNFIFVKFLGHRGLALSTSLAVMTTSFLFLKGVGELIGGISIKTSLIFTIKLFLSSVIMGGLILLIGYIMAINSKQGFGINLLYLILMTLFGFVFYCIMCKFLKVEEVDILKNLFIQKIMK